MTAPSEIDLSFPGPEPQVAGAEPVDQAPSRPGKRWKAILFPIKVLVSAGLLYWILSDVSVREIATALAGANPWILLLTLSSPVLGFYIGAHRWSGLLQAQSVHAPLGTLILSYTVSTFFSNFLPSTIGGDGIRAYDSWRLGASKSTALAVIIVERLLGLTSLLLLAGGAILISPTAVPRMLSLPAWVPWLAGAGMCGIGLVLVVIARWSPPFGVGFQGKLLRIRSALFSFQRERRALLKGLALSLALQANVIVQHFLVAKALGLPVSLLDFLLVIPPCILIMMLPISINGIGIRENIFVVVLAAFGIAQSQALAFAWLLYGLLVAQGIAGSIVYALRKESLSARHAAVLYGNSRLDRDTFAGQTHTPLD